MDGVLDALQYSHGVLPAYCSSRVISIVSRHYRAEKEMNYPVTNLIVLPSAWFMIWYLHLPHKKSKKAEELLLTQTDVFLSKYKLPFTASGDRCFKKGTIWRFMKREEQFLADHGDIDLVLKRSFDNGKTWVRCKSWKVGQRGLPLANLLQLWTGRQAQSTFFSVETTSRRFTPRAPTMARTFIIQQKSLLRLVVLTYSSHPTYPRPLLVTCRTVFRSE
jgi:hypothetical protein